VPLDKEGTRWFHEEFLAAFPGARSELLDLIESGERLGARLVIHARHDGAPWMGIAPSGAEARLAITTLLTVRNGRCVERWSTADMYGFLVQLGALPAPEAG
jgi:predicted ester cyclase